MLPRKPTKTLADYLVIAVSPVLIMLLVGSLSFFLIQIFYRGAGAGGVRWVVFWFVIAAVLVSRIGIEQGSGHAAVYGLALAAVTWLYLVRIHPAYLVGIVLLGTVWWSANRLTRDCTLIDDDEDASGNGLLQVALRWRSRGSGTAASESVKRKPADSSGLAAKARPPTSAPHPPGLWLVYFSLAALPLFGIGQMLLPADDAQSRRIGFTFLFVYMAAALGLLLTTSFLGLRRYLRQRRLPMPGTIVFGWVRFGVGVAVVVLMAALFLPRPGATDAWVTLGYRVDQQLRRASEYALKFNPPGKGQGRPANQPNGSDGQGGSSSTTQGKEQDEKGTTEGNRQSASGRPGEGNQNPNSSQADTNRSPVGAASRLHGLLQAILLLITALLIAWWLFRRWHLIAHIVRSFVAALIQFFRNLLDFGLVAKSRRASQAIWTPRKRRAFAAYENPFVTGSDRVWSPEQLILYSYEALQVWAEEQGVKPQPQRTAREYCHGLGKKFPEVDSELNRLSVLYGHAAYGMKLPENCDLEPVKQLWRHLSESLAVGVS
jgi:Domain of unknown function (DUF4129)